MIKLALLVAAMSASLSTWASTDNMVSGNTVSSKEKRDLCASRAKVGGSALEDFLISTRHVDIMKKTFADATFVVVNESNPQLVLCHTSGSTGRFQPISYMNRSNKSIWREVGPHNPISIDSSDGKKIVAQTCYDAVKSQLDMGLVQKVGLGTITEVRAKSGVKYPINSKINGVSLERYDIVSDGYVTYRSSSNGIDKDSKEYSCLLDPMFKIKSIEIK